MASDSDPLTGLQTQLQMLQDIGFKHVSVQQLAELLDTSKQNVLDYLDRLGIPASDQGIELTPVSIQQSVQRDAFTQVGSQNQQYNVQGTLVQLPEGSAGQLHQLFPQPGEQARVILRKEITNFVSYLQTLPAINNSTDQSGMAWYTTVEAHCKPLVRALFTAIKVVPQDIVDGEITGLMEESIRVLRLQIPGGQFDSSLAWRTYPLLVVATSVVLAVLLTNRWGVLQPLVTPIIQVQSQAKIRWLYLVNYVDELPSKFHFPISARLRYPSLMVERHITQLLVGEEGWLMDELPVFSNEKRARQAHAILSHLILDAELRYFTATEHESQRRLRMGEYHWHKEEAKESIAAMVRGVKLLPTGKSILNGNVDLNYTNFVTLLEKNDSLIF